MKVVSLILCLSVALALKTQLFNAENEVEQQIPEIGRLTILEEELFFIAKNHEQFGFINKTNGKITRLTSIGEGQVIIDETKRTEIVLRNKNNVIYSFNVTSKAGQKINKFKGLKMGEILQHLFVPGQFLILTSNQLRRYDIKQKNQNYTVVVKARNSESFLNIFSLVGEAGEKIIMLVSLEEGEDRKICLRKFQNHQLLKENCLSIKEQGNPEVERSGKIIFVAFETITYAINFQLEIKTRIHEKVLQFHQGAAILDNHCTYYSHSDGIYEYKLIESNDFDNIKMELKQEDIIISSKETEYGKIQRRQGLEPLRSWIKKHQNEDEFDLIIQSTHLDLSLFRVVGDENKQYSIKEIWTRKHPQK